MLPQNDRRRMKKVGFVFDCTHSCAAFHPDENRDPDE
jgi:hypothetical protein